jgi:hypothetical protein
VAASGRAGTATVALTPSGSSATRACLPAVTVDIEPWMLSRAITGTIAFAGPSKPRGSTRHAPEPGLCLEWDSAPAARDPRSVFYRGRRWHASALDLYESGLPPCTHLATLDDRTVLATPYVSSHGWRIRQDGSLIEDDVCWPVSVSGALALDGQRVAWGHDDDGGTLAWWRDGKCHRLVRVGARLGRVVADGTGWLTCSRTNGQAIQVREDDGETRTLDIDVRGVAAASPSAGLFIAGVALGADGRIDRRLDGESFHLGSGGWAAVPNGPLGPCWSVARHRSQTASAYPHADVVTVEIAGQPCAHLAVYYPICVAWAGRSLVVTNVDGEVLIFRELADRVRALAARDEEAAADGVDTWGVRP